MGYIIVCHLMNIFKLEYHLNIFCFLSLPCDILEDTPVWMKCPAVSCIGQVSSRIICRPIGILLKIWKIWHLEFKKFYFGYEKRFILILWMKIHAISFLLSKIFFKVMESRSSVKKMWEQFSSELGSRIDRWRKAFSSIHHNEIPGL